DAARSRRSSMARIALFWNRVTSCSSLGPAGSSGGSSADSGTCPSAPNISLSANGDLTKSRLLVTLTGKQQSLTLAVHACWRGGYGAQPHHATSLRPRGASRFYRRAPDTSHSGRGGRRVG